MRDKALGKLEKKPRECINRLLQFLAYTPAFKTTNDYVYPFEL